MTSWTVPIRADAVDNREPSMYWEDINSASTDDPGNDFFGQFVDFDATGGANAFGGDEFGSVSTTMPAMAESFLLMGDHGPVPDNGLSSGVSSADEFDFLSSSWPIDTAAPGASHEIDPKNLTLSSDDLLTHGTTLHLHNHHSHHHNQQQQQQQQQQQSQPQHAFEYPGGASMSEADLNRLESISLHSPQKPKAAVSDPSSPTPPPTTDDVRKPKKFVDALSSTIKKAAKLRKNKKVVSETQARPGSPVREQPQTLQIPKQRGRGKVRAVTQGNLPVSPPMQQQDQCHTQFVHGHYEDPFRDNGLLPPQGVNLQHYDQVAPDTPVESPGVKSEPGQGQFQVEPAWHQHQQNHQQQQQQQLHWTGAGGEYVTSQEAGWWTPNMMNHGPGPNEYVHHHHQQQQQQQRSASVHVMGHGQHSGMPYEYDSVPDTSTGGLLIHMPQPRGSQSTVVSDLTTNAQTFLPPPPVPQTGGPTMPASERSHRPPKAKSSGARHLSCSPVRKQRGPSASPTPGDQSGGPRSRHSSGASVSSVRSASGRLPGSMPGTPCSVRKRRSRDASGGGISLGGDSGIGFVNFTPSDGGVLMTGVAPSGSSKTKARREKEAQDRRRRLSEAAIKAVAAAGGDVDKLIQQGFAF